MDDDGTCVALTDCNEARTATVLNRVKWHETYIDVHIHARQHEKVKLGKDLPQPFGSKWGFTQVFNVMLATELNI